MKEDFLTHQDKITLLKIARTAIENHLAGNGLRYPDDLEPNDALKTACGAFVTLHHAKTGKLRGCIGRLSSGGELYAVVAQMAIAASSQDSRFNPVTAKELDKLDIEISVLTPLKPIESIDDIEIGRHGIYIKKDYRTGTLLPQVAPENHWSALELVEYCSQYKAQIGKEGWKNAELFTYEAIIFSEKSLLKPE